MDTVLVTTDSNRIFLPMVNLDHVCNHPQWLSCLMCFSHSPFVRISSSPMTTIHYHCPSTVRARLRFTTLCGRTLVSSLSLSWSGYSCTFPQLSRGVTEGRVTFKSSLRSTLHKIVLSLLVDMMILQSSFHRPMFDAVNRLELIFV